jgi:hypothetical protein
MANPDISSIARPAMPAYKSHKTVYALKIRMIEDITSGGSYLHFEDIVSSDVRHVPVLLRYAPLYAGMDYISKHNPQPGGYYVVYEDGYKSWSPAEAFENGYTKIT